MDSANIRWLRPPRGAAFCLAFLALAMVHATSASAALLNLVQQPPDITSVFIFVSYSGTAYSASGSPVAIDFDGIAPPDHAILNGLSSAASFDLNILVDSGGSLAGNFPGDDLVIKGVIDFDDSGTITGSESYQTLLTGEIIRFGYQDISPFHLFEFEFNTTGGTLAGIFGAKIGVILDTGVSSFGGSFEGEFANGGTGVSDTFPTPEPSTMVLLALGGLLLLGHRCIKRTRRVGLAREG